MTVQKIVGSMPRPIVSTGLMVVSQSLVAHGMGSKDTDNGIKMHR